VISCSLVPLAVGTTPSAAEQRSALQWCCWLYSTCIISAAQCSLELMLQDVEGAVAYVKGVISDLLMNRMDLSLLVVTKVLVLDCLRTADAFRAGIGIGWNVGLCMLHACNTPTGALWPAH
jgi:hypothetical protein